MKHLERALVRWINAGVIDQDTAANIRNWESIQDGREFRVHRRMPGTMLGLGALLLSAGIALFVSTHWDAVGPAVRFALLLGALAVIDLSAAVASKFELLKLSMTLTAVGTAALGAVIYLCGQIFNLPENWPSALLLWTAGATVTLCIARDWPHVLMVALLTPAWLLSEWVGALPTVQYLWMNRIPTVGMVLLAFAYLSAAKRDDDSQWRRSLTRLGAVALIPSCVVLAWLGPAQHPAFKSNLRADSLLPLVGWLTCILVPLGACAAFRGKQATYLIIVVGWALLVSGIDWRVPTEELALYALYAIGSAGVVMWGVKESVSEAINVGVFAFACTIFGFYYSTLFDKLSRSLGLASLGLLLIIAGGLLEMARRRLLARISGDST